MQDDIDYWMVGAYWVDQDPADQTARFLRDGIWENGYDGKFLNEVRQVKVGDRIAIKATSTQKSGLPFDVNGQTMSYLAIKAIGIVTENFDDGRQLRVQWDPPFPKPKIWYFYTNRQTIWHLRKDVEYAQRLIAFTFYGELQDYEWFLSHGFPINYGKSAKNAKALADLTDASFDPAETALHESATPYSIEDVLADGAFLSAETLTAIIDRWQHKKNLILQGAPGVGKTFLARRLAYALMKERDPERIGAIQFHQSYSYDDFVRGYRPQPAGGFAIKDGVFFSFCKRAQADEEPDRVWVFIIDEINRGNLSQIFGELMMLLESDKRSEEFAVPLVYPRSDGETFFVPANVYVIGLMNIADRSLALVDYALRRRFAFETLTPQFENPQFKNWLQSRHMNENLITLVIERLTQLNESISGDKLLGPAFQVGHSFFCPRGDDLSTLDRQWYSGIVETEIVPLLQEYWYDNPEKVEAERFALLL